MGDPVIALLSVAVSRISWYDEDKSFAVGYADGMISICSKEEYETPVSVEAHEVCGHYVFFK